MNEIKTCVDCQFMIKKPPRGFYFEFCNHPKARSVVRGDALACTDVRGDVNKCGPNGKWFVKNAIERQEPKMGFWSKLLYGDF